MSDTAAMGRIIVGLSLVMLMASFFMPGNSSWNALVGTLSAGPSLPTPPAQPPPLTNATGLIHTIPFTPYGVVSGYPPDSTNGTGNGCIPGYITVFDWHLCVQTEDGNLSYVTTGTSGYFEIQMASQQTTDELRDPAWSPILWMNLTYQCSAISGGNTNISFIWQTSIVLMDTQVCSSTSWTTYSFNVNMTGLFGYGTYIKGSEPIQIVRFYANTTGNLFLSYFHVDMTYISQNYRPSVSCVGGDIACQIGQGWTWFADAVNGVIANGGFIISYLWFILIFAVSLVIFVFQLLVSFLVGMVLSLVWLTTGLTAPPINAPAIVQGIIDVPVFGMLAMLFFTILSWIRGNG